MLTIYSMSESVEAWVGRHGPNTPLAMLWLSTLNVPLDKHQLEIALTDERLSSGLEDLRTRPWWTRIWVQQEVFANPNVHFRCGDDRVPLKIVECGLQIETPFFRRTPNVAGELAHGERSNPDLRELDHETDLFNVLGKMYRKECSNPRDHIYGILGMSRAVSGTAGHLTASPSLVVDYRKDVSVVFADTARYIMQRDGLLNALLIYRFEESSRFELNLPSWVPNWTSPFARAFWLDHCGNRDTLINQFRTLTTVTDKDAFLSNSDPLRLTLKGFILGVVQNAPAAEQREEIFQLKLNPPKVRKQVNKWLIKQLPSMYVWPDTAEYMSKRQSFDSALARDAPRVARNHARGAEFPFEIQTGFSEKDKIRIPANLLDRVSVGRWPCLHPELMARPFTYNAAPSHLEVGVGVVRTTPCDGVFADPDTDPVYDSQLRREIFKLLSCHFAESKEWEEVCAPLQNLLCEPVTDLIPRFWTVPTQAREGDVVLAVEGGQLPLIVRATGGEPATFTFIGPAMMTIWNFRGSECSLEAGWCAPEYYTGSMGFWTQVKTGSAMKPQPEPPKQYTGTMYWLVILALLKVLQQQAMLDTFQLV